MSAPWKGGLRRWHGVAANWIVDESGEDIAQAHGDAREGQEAIARAKALVHRANAYPKLVDLLQRWVDDMEDPDDAVVVSLYHETRAALASTREEK